MKHSLAFDLLYQMRIPCFGKRKTACDKLSKTIITRLTTLRAKEKAVIVEAYQQTHLYISWSRVENSFGNQACLWKNYFPLFECMFTDVSIFGWDTLTFFAKTPYNARMLRNRLQWPQQTWRRYALSHLCNVCMRAMDVQRTISNEKSRPITKSVHESSTLFFCTSSCSRE